MRKLKSPDLRGDHVLLFPSPLLPGELISHLCHTFREINFFLGFIWTQCLVGARDSSGLI